MQPHSIQIPKPLEIHIWKIILDQQENAKVRFARLLSRNERRRSEQFHFDHLRQRYIITHGALRVILAAYCGKPPETLQFGHGGFGKPFLADPPDSVEFNLSHCEDLSLIAVTAGPSVGVDVEKVRQMQSLDSILNRYFSTEERRYINSVSGHDQTQAFLTLWTRREAVAKALGLDLAAALTKIRIPLFPFGESTVVSQPGGVNAEEGNTHQPWCVQDLKLDEHHRGAVCLKGKMCDLFIRDFK